MKSIYKKTNKISSIFNLTIALCFMFFTFFIVSCENSTEPDGTLNFSDMEIHYSKVGGWIQTSKLDIMGNGTVNAFEISQASRDTIKSSSTLLNESKKEKLSNLFSSFSKYESFYTPVQYYTDGNNYQIIFIYEGKADTVNVYEPHEAKIPFSLTEIIFELEDIWMNTL